MAQNSGGFMKKYCSVILLTLLSIVTHSQVISDYGIKFGIVSSKANLDIKPTNTFNGWDDWFNMNRIGVSFGIFINMFDTDYFDIQSELSYLEEGSEDELLVTTADNPDGNGDYMVSDHEYDFLKLNFSIRPKYKFDKITPYLLLGPSISYLLKDRGTFFIEDLEKVHFGYSLGLGINIDKVFNNSFFCEFKYNDYFKEISDNDRAKLELSSWQINIGIQLK